MPTPDNSALPKIALHLFLIALVILLVIIVGGYWLAVRAMHPVHLITQTAQVHGGEVCLRSTMGHGSRFEIWLPLVEGSDYDEHGRKDTLAIPVQLSTSG
ncbi:hypothetical protein ccbrp13_39480 [Ktedonobacteria bacterium brp13]|nr:hypothetical protein ccbrp13_39480 [Ktedonobacteria bacterium brp13]